MGSLNYCYVNFATNDCNALEISLREVSSFSVFKRGLIVFQLLPVLLLLLLLLLLS